MRSMACGVERGGPSEVVGAEVELVWYVSQCGRWLGFGGVGQGGVLWVLVMGKGVKAKVGMGEARVGGWM